MKKLKMMLTVALCGGLMNGTLFAGSNPPEGQPQGAQKMSFQVGMYRVQKSLTMNVMVEKKLGDRVEINLVDQKGNVLYEHVMGRREQKLGYKLDFSEVQDGNYSVVVTNGTQKLVKEIHLSTFSLYEMPARNLVTVN